MEAKIIQFYADKYLHIPKLIKKRPKDITPGQVELAAEKVYSEIQKGHKIKDLSMARYVWDIAKTINADAYFEEQKLLQNCKGILDEKNNKIKNLVDDLIQRDSLYNRLLIYVSIAAILAVGHVVWEVLCIL